MVYTVHPSAPTSNFSVWWPQLETKLKKWPADDGETGKPKRRGQYEILEEILELVRSQARKEGKEKVSSPATKAILKHLMEEAEGQKLKERIAALREQLARIDEKSAEHKVIYEELQQLLKAQAERDFFINWSAPVTQSLAGKMASLTSENKSPLFLLFHWILK